MTMGRSIILSDGEYYHIYNRGTEKRNIFGPGKKDPERMLSLIYLCNDTGAVDVKKYDDLRDALTSPRGPSLISLCAYCLMPNHFHLIVRQEQENGISKFMQKLSTGYTMYFNQRYERTGALFQGTFKAKHISDDRHLQYMISYLHLNPVKLIDPKWKENGIANRQIAEKYLDTYRYSSYLDYCGKKRPEGTLIEMESLPGDFDTPKGFKSLVTEWLNQAPV
jgi:putative transposase